MTELSFFSKSTEDLRADQNLDDDCDPMLAPWAAHVSLCFGGCERGSNGLLYVRAVSYVKGMEPKGWSILVNKHFRPSLNFPFL